MNAIIEERGNGFPDVGDYVAGSDGELYRVLELSGPIHTGQRAGAPNYIHAIVALADWSDVDPDKEPRCSAQLDSGGSND